VTKPARQRYFKYLNQNDAQFVYRDQTVRLSHSEEVRKAETGQAAGFADPQEMLSVWKPGPSRLVVGPSHPLATRLNIPQKIEVVVGPDAGIIFADYGSMYCLCGSDAPATRSRMNVEFGYDAFFEVRNMRGLLTAIQRAVGRPARCDWVRYQDTDVRDPSQCYSDPFRKPSRFAWQQEYRLVTEPLDNGIVHVPSMLAHIGNLQLI